MNNFTRAKNSRLSFFMRFVNICDGLALYPIDQSHIAKQDKWLAHYDTLVK